MPSPSYWKNREMVWSKGSEYLVSVEFNRMLNFPYVLVHQIEYCLLALTYITLARIWACAIHILFVMWHLSSIWLVLHDSVHGDREVQPFWPGPLFFSRRGWTQYYVCCCINRMWTYICMTVFDRILHHVTNKWLASWLGYEATSGAHTCQSDFSIMRSRLLLVLSPDPPPPPHKERVYNHLQLHNS